MVIEMIANQETDLVGIFRPLISESNLIKRWQLWDNKNSTCISCNKCVLALGEGKPLQCYMDIK
jgi:2,4-dienoyl-CoA reductase-like NADH-dependent reductase (Old Yellow Enzyme family)